jgi:hypothetical protein
VTLTDKVWLCPKGTGESLQEPKPRVALLLPRLGTVMEAEWARVADGLGAGMTPWFLA